MDRPTWLALSPDEGDHLQRIPQAWSVNMIRKIAPSIDIVLYSMWTCLLLPMLQKFPALAEWYRRDAQGFALAFEETAAAILLAGELTPSPIFVGKEMLPRAPALAATPASRGAVRPGEDGLPEDLSPRKRRKRHAQEGRHG